MAGTATPVRPAAKGAERDGRTDGGTAWVKGQNPPTGEELTAAGVVFDVEIGLVSGSEANRHARECPEAYADPEEATPPSRRDPEYATVNQMMSEIFAALRSAAEK